MNLLSKTKPRNLDFEKITDPTVTTLGNWWCQPAEEIPTLWPEKQKCIHIKCKMNLLSKRRPSNTEFEKYYWRFTHSSLNLVSSTGTLR